MNDKLPTSMIDKARDAFHEHDTQVDEDDLGWFWSCNCGGKTYNRTDDDGEAYDAADRHVFGAVLAADLDGCEVRNEWIAEIDLGEGFKPRPWIYHNEDEARSYMRAIVKPKRLKRRFIIATPAAPYTEETRA